jgi:hypothetical protein
MNAHAFETVTRPGNLAPVGSKLREQPSARTGPAGEDSPVPGSPLRWAPWLVLAIAAAVGAVAAASTLLIVACVVVLAGAATGLGWRVGEHRREALEQEIESRSSELTRAFTELEIAQAETVRRLSMAVEFRDEDTGAHIERIGRFSTLLA